MGTPPGVCPMEFWVMLQSIMGYGYPPPLGVNKLTKWNYYLPVVLRTRAVIKVSKIKLQRNESKLSRIYTDVTVGSSTEPRIDEKLRTKERTTTLQVLNVCQTRWTFRNSNPGTSTLNFRQNISRQNTFQFWTWFPLYIVTLESDLSLHVRDILGIHLWAGWYPPLALIQSGEKYLPGVSPGNPLDLMCRYQIST